jgi:hypothetical protein
VKKSRAWTFPCAICSGRGWVVRPPETHATECPSCEGVRDVHVPSRLGETVATLVRVMALRSRRRVCVRVLDALATNGLLPQKGERQLAMFGERP